MNKRFKDMHEPSVSNSSLMHRGKQELKNIKVAVRRKDVPESNHSGPLQRDLENPDDLVVHRQGEGQRPIFSREDIVVNQEFETRVVVTSPTHPSSSRRSRSHSVEPRGKGRYKSKSPQRYRSSPDRRCSYSKDRRRSRSLTPPGNRYKNSKDVLKTVTSKNDRSPSPPYSRRKFPNKEDNIRDYGNSGKYGKSSSKDTKRSSTPEERSKYYKYKSPSRKSSHSPHRMDRYRGAATPEKYRRRSPSPHGRDVDYKHRNDLEKYHRRSRSPYKSRNSRGRSPYGPEGYRSPSKFDRKSRSPHADLRYREYRKHSRSPRRHEGYRGSPKRYSRSPPRRDRGYRGPDRSRRRTPSPYRESRRPEIRMRYQEIPPTIGPPGVNFVRAPWFTPMYGAWRDPSRPELIPPHVVIRPPPPEFYAPPFSILGAARPPRPPIIYNNRNTKFPQIRKPTSTVTSSSAVATTTNAACSTATIEEVKDREKIQLADADESQTLNIQTDEANSSDTVDSTPIEN